MGFCLLGKSGPKMQEQRGPYTGSACKSTSDTSGGDARVGLEAAAGSAPRIRPRVKPLHASVAAQTRSESEIQSSRPGSFVRCLDARRTDLGSTHTRICVDKNILATCSCFPSCSCYEFRSGNSHISKQTDRKRCQVGNVDVGAKAACHTNMRHLNQDPL